MISRKSGMLTAAIAIPTLGLIACVWGDSSVDGEIFIDGDFAGAPANFPPTCDGEQSSSGDISRPVSAIQAIGDSLLAMHKEEGLSIPDALAQELDIPLAHNAVSGAELAERDIQNQYEPGLGSHVIVTGGANDLARECSQANLDQLISADLRSGLMVDLVNEIGQSGSQALLTSYFTPYNGEIGCPLFKDLLSRYRALGEARADAVYICTLDIILPGQTELYADSVHPSDIGSEKIGLAIADMLR